jgi:hypothetical protein
MTRKRNLDLKRQRATERDIKQQRLDSALIVISDSDEDEEPEGFVRVGRYVKPELFRVLNSFQASPTKGVFVSDRLRDPRRDPLDGYIGEIRDHAHGITDLTIQLGCADTPLSAADREAFTRFAETLERLAQRIRDATSDPVPRHLA